jgi:hypothetical protein
LAASLAKFTRMHLGPTHAHGLSRLITLIFMWDQRFVTWDFDYRSFNEKTQPHHSLALNSHVAHSSPHVFTQWHLFVSPATHPIELRLVKGIYFISS